MGKRSFLKERTVRENPTQFSLLTRRLQARGVDFRTMVFPQYTELSSALIRMYRRRVRRASLGRQRLHGLDLHAVDRFAAFRKVWGEYYRNGGLMLSDRYTTSNAVHQASKEPEQGPREVFLRGSYDLEYRHMGLPVPDLVLYLDVPTELTGQDAAPPRARYAYARGHPRAEYGLSAPLLRHGLQAAKYYGWTVIACAKDGKMRSIDDIHNEIFLRVQECLKEN